MPEPKTVGVGADALSAAAAPNSAKPSCECVVPSDQGGAAEQLAAGPSPGVRSVVHGRMVAGDPASEGMVAKPRGVLSPEVEGVVARWHPHGLALLLAMRCAESDSAGPVALIGGDETNTGLLRAELARCVPRVELLGSAGAGCEYVGETRGFDGDGVVTTLAVTTVDESGRGDAAEIGAAQGVNAREGELMRPVAVACVVLEAGAPIGREMLGVVRGLRASGTRVVFALEGFHAHAEWREVLAADREALAADREVLAPDLEVLGAEVEIVAVSARLAGLARVNGDVALEDRAGVGLLHARLVAAVGAGPVGDQVGIVRERVIGETRERIGRELEKLRGGGDVAGLRAERARLVAVGDGGRGAAMSMLRNRVHLARVDLVHEVGVRIRGLNAAARVEIAQLSRAGQAGYPQGLQEAVEKITREIDRAVRVRLREVGGLVEKSVGAAGVSEDAGRVESGVAGADRSPRVGSGPDPRCGGVEDHLMIAVGASAGFGLGRLVVAPLALWEALNYAIVPVSLFLGAAVAGWVVRARRELAERAHLGQWVTDALVNVKAQLEQRVATALVAAEERLTEHVVSSTTAHLVETDRRVGELEARLRQAAQRRPALSAACERDLAALEFV